MPGFLIQRRKSSQQKDRGGSLEFPASARLFDSSHPCRRIYLLQSGLVQLSSGREAIVDYLAPGDFFGEKCVLKRRAAEQTAKALSPVKVDAFRRSELLDLQRRDRAFWLRLVKNLAERLDRSEVMIHAFVTERAERRLARLLFRFMPARAASGWVRLRFSPSNSELARTVGTTRARIAHFMRHFQQLGWLRRQPELWVEREGLREFLASTAKQA